MNPMMKKTTQCLGAIAFLLMASAAQAVPVVQNHNFAAGETFWSFVGTNLLDSASATPDGNGITNSARYASGDAQSGSLSQTLLTSFNATNAYRLEFFYRGDVSLLGNFALGTIISTDVDKFEDGGDPDEFLRYVVEFNGYSGNLLTFNFSGATGGATNATTLLVDDISVACVTGQTSGDCGGGTTPPPNETPEPGSLLLVGAALAGLAGMRMRRKN